MSDRRECNFREHKIMYGISTLYCAQRGMIKFYVNGEQMRGERKKTNRKTELD